MIRVAAVLRMILTPYIRPTQAKTGLEWATLYVADDDKTIAAADLFQDLEKQVAISRAVEQRTAPVATRGDEAKVSGAVVAMESVGHGGFIA
jgi:hypothetical protein